MIDKRGASAAEVTPNGFRLVELSPGIDFNFVQERTGAPLLRAPEPIQAGGAEK